MNFAVYTIFVHNGQIIHEILHCDITEEFAYVLMDSLEHKYPLRIFYVDKLKTEHVVIRLN